MKASFLAGREKGRFHRIPERTNSSQLVGEPARELVSGKRVCHYVAVTTFVIIIDERAG